MPSADNFWKNWSKPVSQSFSCWTYPGSPGAYAPHGRPLLVSATTGFVGEVGAQLLRESCASATYPYTTCTFACSSDRMYPSEYCGVGLKPLAWLKPVMGTPSVCVIGLTCEATYLCPNSALMP